MKFNKEKFKHNILLPIIACFIIIGVIFFSKTFAIYLSNGESNANIDLAFSLLNINELSTEIKLSDIKPDSTVKEYTFEVTNYEEDKLIDVNMEYTVSIIATTNLPITYSLKDINGNTIPLTNEYITDDDGTIFYVIKTNTYQVGYNSKNERKFKLTYSLDATYNDDKYQDVIELVTIRVDAKQI